MAEASLEAGGTGINYKTKAGRAPRLQRTAGGAGITPDSFRLDCAACCALSACLLHVMLRVYPFIVCMGATPHLASGEVASCSC